MRIPPILALAVCALVATGCHSHYIEASVVNHTPQPIPLIEVDYPSASFGTENLAPNATFHYRFKVLGSGPTKLLYTDAAHHDHSNPGPTLHEGDEGPLTLEITPTTPNWKFSPNH
jgi:hypothetical protein